MTVANVWSLTNDDLNEQAEAVKVSILGALVTEKLITIEDAQKWAENHAVIIRKETKFRSLLRKLMKKKELNYETLHYVVVKSVPITIDYTVKNTSDT